LRSFCRWSKDRARFSSVRRYQVFSWGILVLTLCPQFALSCFGDSFVITSQQTSVRVRAINVGSIFGEGHGSEDVSEISPWFVRAEAAFAKDDVFTEGSAAGQPGDFRGHAAATSLNQDGRQLAGQALVTSLWLAQIQAPITPIKLSLTWSFSLSKISNDLGHVAYTFSIQLYSRVSDRVLAVYVAQSDDKLGAYSIVVPVLPSDNLELRFGIEVSALAHPIGGSASADFQATVDLRQIEMCDFSKQTGIERCFGGVGSQCDETIKHEDGCFAKGLMSVGSILHDLCCIRTGNSGAFCANPSGTSKCLKEFIEAAAELTCPGRTWAHLFGPYPIGNPGDDTSATNPALRATSGTRVYPDHQHMCSSNRCRAGADGNRRIGFDKCGVYCECQ
jgi:hypothetical protein